MLPAAGMLVLALAALPAHADLYRWIDPDTGSVKLSNLPPADSRVNAQVVPDRSPAPKAAAAGTRAPSSPKPPAAPAGAAQSSPTPPVQK